MSNILETLDAPVKPVNAPQGGPVILVFLTERPWDAETGAAVVRAMRDRYWNWNGLVVNLRPGEDIAALDEERAHALYQALEARYGPDSGHTCGAECGASPV